MLFRFGFRFLRGRYFFRGRFSFFNDCRFWQIHSRRRPTTRPTGHSSTVDEISVRGSAVGMGIDRSFKLSVDHVAVITHVYLPVRGVPGEITKAARIILFVPIARPTRRLARLRSAVPDHRFTVPGLLVFTLGQGRAREHEQQTATKRNQSKSQSHFHKAKKDVTAWRTISNQQSAVKRSVVGSQRSFVSSRS